MKHKVSLPLDKEITPFYLILFQTSQLKQIHGWTTSPLCVVLHLIFIVLRNTSHEQWLEHLPKQYKSTHQVLLQTPQSPFPYTTTIPLGSLQETDKTPTPPQQQQKCATCATPTSARVNTPTSRTSHAPTQAVSSADSPSPPRQSPRRDGRSCDKPSALAQQPQQAPARCAPRTATSAENRGTWLARGTLERVLAM